MMILGKVNWILRKENMRRLCIYVDIVGVVQWNIVEYHMYIIYGYINCRGFRVLERWRCEKGDGGSAFL